jgi:hypothetical protein
MSRRVVQRTRQLTVVAQDPSLRDAGGTLLAKLSVPTERLDPGPTGARVRVVDFDASTGALYDPLHLEQERDPFSHWDPDDLVANHHFHAQNVYAIVMCTLSRFEFALGRRLSWGFRGPQLKVAPHAFADANAFYSRRDEGLLFGYFPAADDGKLVFSCLSHDVVAHETAHALVDGLRERYTYPSSPQQAGFHEGFADVVALLSIFALRPVVARVIDQHLTGDLADAGATTIDPAALTTEKLRRSVVFGLAEQMGSQMQHVRGDALRRSVQLPPAKDYLARAEYYEPHRAGEVFVAAVMNAFLAVWVRRLQSLGRDSRGHLDRGRVVEEGAEIADHLLDKVIRALDYAPPVDVSFADFLSAVITADRELQPDDSKYQFRTTLRQAFADYGIEPASSADGGAWEPPDAPLDYDRTHFEPMQREPDEVFRFIWENFEALGLSEHAFSRVISVRPCLRVGEDGFALRETVAEYVQTLIINAGELSRFGIDKPDRMRSDVELHLYGGGALIFDEYGKVKFHVRNRVISPQRQSDRLQYLSDHGYFHPAIREQRHFAAFHRRRVRATANEFVEDYV